MLPFKRSKLHFGLELYSGLWSSVSFRFDFWDLIVPSLCQEASSLGAHTRPETAPSCLLHLCFCVAIAFLLRCNAVTIYHLNAQWEHITLLHNPRPLAHQIRAIDRTAACWEATQICRQRLYVSEHFFLPRLHSAAIDQVSDLAWMSAGWRCVPSSNNYFCLPASVVYHK